jgi:hypothetical protein
MLPGKGEHCAPLQVTGAFAPTGNLIRARHGHSATLLPDGKVLIVGGFGPLESTKSGGCPLPSSCGPLTSAEIYDPSSRTFTRAQLRRVDS